MEKLLIILYLNLGFYAIARTNYFISKRDKNWGKWIHRVLHLINIVVYFNILCELIIWEYNPDMYAASLTEIESIFMSVAGTSWPLISSERGYDKTYKKPYTFH